MKQRAGNVCKKKECVRHENYTKWSCGDISLSYCMNCKWAHVSQFERKAESAKGE